jgi:cytochrome P450
MKREELSKGNRLMEEDGEGIDLLTSYMSEDYNMGFKSDDEFLRDTIVTFMLAGRDTVSSCLSWFFWLVSKNPAAGAKIREELKTTVPEKEAEKRRLFDIEEIKKLVYLHGALCESLRLYPPIHSEFKSPVRQDILPSGHRVNPKTKIVFSLYAMGRMSSVWGDDCFEFKPERWITDRGGMKHEPSYKFFSFNAGPRTCLGKDVAFTQMKAVVAAIIYNYQVQVVDEHTVTPSQSVILHMKHGMKVKLTKRWA